MDEAQFRELMECMDGIKDRLEAIESAVSSVESSVSLVDSSISLLNSSQPEYCAYTLEDVVKALWELKGPSASVNEF